MNLQHTLRHWQNKNDTLLSVHTPTQREREMCFNYLVKNNFKWCSGHLIKYHITDIWERDDTRYIQVAGTSFASHPPTRDEDSWFRCYGFNDFKILSFPEFLRFCKDTIARGECT